MLTIVLAHTQHQPNNNHETSLKIHDYTVIETSCESNDEFFVELFENLDQGKTLSTLLLL